MDRDVATSAEAAELRIARAVERIERAAEELEARHARLEEAARATLSDLDGLITRMAAHG